MGEKVEETGMKDSEQMWGISLPGGGHTPSWPRGCWLSEF